MIMNINYSHRIHLQGGPNLIICALVMFLNRAFRQEWFNRFLRFLASLIKNGWTLRKCYLFSYRYRSVWDIDICLKKKVKQVRPFFIKDAKNHGNRLNHSCRKTPFKNITNAHVKRFGHLKVIYMWRTVKKRSWCPPNIRFLFKENKWEIFS